VGSHAHKGTMEKRNMVAPFRLHSSYLVSLRDDSNRNDAKSVSIVALGCFHPVVKVQSASIHFFLGSEDEQEDSESEDEVFTLAACLRN
jgi:hypothetical protein